jgi:hypothetical protein
MLFDQARHERLLTAEWDEHRVRAAITAIVRDIEDACHPGEFWPTHPLDQEVDDPAIWHKSLYLGAAGTLWALWHLQRAGAVQLRIEPPALIGAVDAAYQAEPDTGEVVPSYFLGEAGILLVLWRLTGAPEAPDRLWRCIDANIANPTNEFLWAAPGTMLAAWHMHEWTGEPRWRELFLANVEQLWRSWLPTGPGNCQLWTQHLYGQVRQYLGAGHGFAGNVLPLLRGAALLPEDRREELYGCCAETLLATAVLDEGCANWLPAPDSSRMLVQWCHGAPGIVTSLRDYPAQHSAAMEALLLKAGEMVWRAGPLEKGFGLCHGTAGNGYAFLTLYRRTGDPAWLERARAFGMHALAQSEQMRQRHGRGRYALWTGDPGLAVYLWHCLIGADGMPGLDRFE